MGSYKQALIDKILPKYIDCDRNFNYEGGLYIEMIVMIFMP